LAVTNKTFLVVVGLIMIVLLGILLVNKFEECVSLSVNGKPCEVKWSGRFGLGGPQCCYASRPDPLKGGPLESSPAPGQTNLPFPPNMPGALPANAPPQIQRNQVAPAPTVSPAAP
jgi:hypothetical protein